MPETIIGSGVNTLKYEALQLDQQGASLAFISFHVVVSRHKVIFKNGVNYIQGNGEINGDEKTDFKAIEYSYRFGFRQRDDIILEFNGSNSEDLALITGYVADPTTGAKKADLVIEEKIYNSI